MFQPTPDQSIPPNLKYGFCCGADGYVPGMKRSSVSPSYLTMSKDRPRDASPSPTATMMMLRIVFLMHSH